MKKLDGLSSVPPPRCTREISPHKRKFFGIRAKKRALNKIHFAWNVRLVMAKEVTPSKSSDGFGCVPLKPFGKI